MSLSMAFSDLKNFYLFVVDHVIAGPQTLSYFAPFVLLPAALMVPPEVMSQRQLVCYFLMPIYACVFHAWWVMKCWDIVSLDGLLWSTFILALDDPRISYRRLRLTAEPESGHILISPMRAAREPNGTSKDQRKDSGVYEGTSSTSLIASPILAKSVSLASPYRLVEESYPLDMGTRLYWVLNLVSSDRLVRWIIGNKRHDAKQYGQIPSRRRFCLNLMPQFLIAYVLLSYSTLHARHDPYLTCPHIFSIFSPYAPAEDFTGRTPATITFFQSHVPGPILRPLTIGLYAYALVTFLFVLLAPPVIFLNWLTGLPSDEWSPHTLPPYFGSFAHGVLENGVRGLWGTFWHAHITYMVLAPGKVLARLLGLDGRDAQGKRHWLGTALPMASAFLFSGLIHMGLVPREPAYQQSGVGPWSLRLRIATVFWMQPVGIALEVLLVALIKKTVPRRFKDENGKIKEDNVLVKTVFRALRLIWTLTWLSCSSPLLAIPFADLGYWNISKARFLPEWLRWLNGGGWLP